MPEEIPPQPCPIDCPNRGKQISDRQRGKWGSYAFALFLSGLALAFSFDPTPQGWQPKEDPPVLVWGVLLPIIGGCLGVQVEPETIARILSAVTTTK